MVQLAKHDQQQLDKAKDLIDAGPLREMGFVRSLLFGQLRLDKVMPYPGQDAQDAQCPKYAQHAQCAQGAHTAWYKWIPGWGDQSGYAAFYPPPEIYMNDPDKALDWCKQVW